MKRMFLIIVLIFSCSHIFAKDRSIGVGIIIGQPTGLSLGYRISDENIMNFAAAWSLEHNSSFLFQGDYIFKSNRYTNFHNQLSLFYGVGAQLTLVFDDFSLGARVPLGVIYQFDNSRFDVFFELAPVLQVIPSTDFYINGGLGVRYFFE